MWSKLILYADHTCTLILPYNFQSGTCLPAQGVGDINVATNLQPYTALSCIYCMNGSEFPLHFVAWHLTEWRWLLSQPLFIRWRPHLKGLEKWQGLSRHNSEIETHGIVSECINRWLVPPHMSKGEQIWSEWGSLQISLWWAVHPWFSRGEWRWGGSRYNGIHHDVQWELITAEN